MPPRARVTKEMVTDAAFGIARKKGAEHISARSVSEMLNCSTQPVMYHFSTIEELKKAAYVKADHYHTEYLMRSTKPGEDAILEIGLNYIRFAIEEPGLFRFLFQSGFGGYNSLPEMMDSDDLTPVLSAMRKRMNMGMEQVKEVFLILAVFVHGYACIIAGNSLKYEEEQLKAHLERVYTGALLVIQKEKPVEEDGNEETI